MSYWIIKEVGAQMPASCRSRYSIVRVLEVKAGVTDVPSVRSKDVIRVVWESGAVPHGGTTTRSGYVKAWAKARDMITHRNEIEERAREAEAAAARRRAEVALREEGKRIEEKRAIQDAIVSKLERGEKLTPEEFAAI